MRQGIVMTMVLLSASMLSACERGDASSAPKPAPKATEDVSLASVHADSPGIAWFNGNVESAFASAKASNKPVLLYWGAQWCPP
jgi:protein disulfide-isomerase